ncbi:MAG: protein phosphatase 2C domain-containing protein [Deltaproteobacteria bacterium]|nr:protein phosphatase 2C domain-containing protein [Deltaproteobacteria bacterium]
MKSLTRDGRAPTLVAMVACAECGFDSTDTAFCDRCGRAFASVVRPASAESALAAIPEGFARLSDRFRQPAIEWTEALLVAEALVAALEPIHREGRVHARLDPHEIAEGPAREMRLLRVNDLSPNGTLANGRVVVPGYSAPEVFGRGAGRLVPATDVFSIGAILWRLVTGRDPFSDFDDLSLAYPSPRLVASVPFELDSFVARSVALLAQERFQSLDDFRVALRRTRARVYAREHGTAATRLEAASATDIGRAKGAAHPVNQDAIICDAGADGSLFAAIDGVTHADVGSGGAAAAITREVLVSRREWPVVARLSVANAAVVEATKVLAPSYDGDPSGIMGAVVVAAEWRVGILSLAWLGDARVYLLRDGDLVQLTIDHDAATDALRSGASPKLARELSAGGRLTRAVGAAVRDDAGHLVAADVSPDALDVKLLPGDRVVLTTDGIPDWISSDERRSAPSIAAILAEAPSPDAAARRLVDAANEGGGGDNLSCIVLFAF